jgi:hypothetical protein
MKKIIIILMAVIGFGISASAQYINATIDGENISCKAEETRYNIYVAAPVAIVYNERSGKATIAYLKGKKFYIGETPAVLNCSNVGINTLKITRSCNLYYAGDNYDKAALSRLLDFDVTFKGNYYSCSAFTVEW